MATETWDSRLARAMVSPLRNTPVHPNHVTTLSLLLGLGAAALFATGQPLHANIAALLYVFSELVDHADGELARMTGKTSKAGHTYDLCVDFITYIALFTGMGIGLSDGSLGNWAIAMGVLVGFSISMIFSQQLIMETKVHDNPLKDANLAGFEAQDAMYLLAPITWLGWLQPFLIASAIGTPVFAIINFYLYKKLR